MPWGLRDGVEGLQRPRVPNRCALEERRNRPWSFGGPRYRNDRVGAETNPLLAEARTVTRRHFGRR